MTGQNNKNINIRPLKKSVIQPEPVSIQRAVPAKDNKSADVSDSVSKQVAALKKITGEIIAVNPADGKLPELEKSLQKAFTENQNLTRTIDSVKKENERLHSTIDRLNKDAENGKAIAESNVKSRIEAEKKILELQSEITILKDHISALQNQLSTANNDILKPDQVSSLMDDIRNNLSDDLPGLLIREIELRLNVQVRPQGENEVIMIPVTREKANTGTNGEFVLRMMPFRR